MQLDHLPCTKCPDCGAAVIAERKERRHCNGHYNETQEFECGKIIKWSPNYMGYDSQSSVECPNTPKNVAKIEKRKQARQALIDFIDTLDVDDTFKSTLNSHGSSCTWCIK